MVTAKDNVMGRFSVEVELANDSMPVMSHPYPSVTICQSEVGSYGFPIRPQNPRLAGSDAAA